MLAYCLVLTLILAGKTLHELITPIEDRKAAVREFVEQVRPEIEYEVVTLRDVYGPTVTDEKLQCIVVSEETKKGADMINQQRVGRVCYW